MRTMAWDWSQTELVPWSGYITGHVLPRLGGETIAG
jgi:hypothetical protein